MTSGWTAKRLLVVMVWWFAVISASGEVAYMHFRSKAGCRTVQQAYVYSHIKVTSCQLLN